MSSDHHVTIPTGRHLAVITIIPNIIHPMSSSSSSIIINIIIIIDIITIYRHCHRHHWLPSLSPSLILPLTGHYLAVIVIIITNKYHHHRSPVTDHRSTDRSIPSTSTVNQQSTTTRQPMSHHHQHHHQQHVNRSPGHTNIPIIIITRRQHHVNIRSPSS